MFAFTSTRDHRILESIDSTVRTSASTSWHPTGSIRSHSVLCRGQKHGATAAQHHGSFHRTHLQGMFPYTILQLHELSSFVNCEQGCKGCFPAVSILACHYKHAAEISMYYGYAASISAVSDMHHLPCVINTEISIKHGCAS